MRNARSSFAIGRIFVWLVYAFLYAPLLVVIVYSVNSSRYSTAWGEFTAPRTLTVET